MRSVERDARQRYIRRDLNLNATDGIAQESPTPLPSPPLFLLFPPFPLILKEVPIRPRHRSPPWKVENKPCLRSQARILEMSASHKSQRLICDPISCFAPLHTQLMHVILPENVALQGLCTCTDIELPEKVPPQTTYRDNNQTRLWWFETGFWENTACNVLPLPLLSSVPLLLASVRPNTIFRKKWENGRNTVSRVLFRKRDLTEFCSKLGEFWARWVCFSTQIIGWKELTEFSPRNSLRPTKSHWVWCLTLRNRIRTVQTYYFSQ